MAMPSDQVRATSECSKPPKTRIDTCWHVPVIAALVACFVSIGMVHSGFFFVGMMEELGTDRKTASWPRNLMGVMVNVSGFVICLLRRWLSLFQILLLGSTIAWAGLIAAAFSPNMAWLTITYGGIYGAGLGVSMISVGMVVILYFEKYRGLASGITFLGFSLSTIIFPLILPYAHEEYGFRGTIFLCGALTMNATALAVLLKEPHWVKQMRREIGKDRGPTQSQSPVQKRRLQVFPSVSIGAGSSTKTESQHASLRLLQKPAFYAIVVSFVCFDYLSVSFQSTMVDYALDKGISLSRAETIIVYSSGTQLLGRILIPLIADNGYVSRSTLVMTNFLLLGCSLLALPHCSTFPSLLFTCLWLEIFFPFVSLMKEVLMADHLGIDTIPACTAIGGLATAPLLLCGPTIIGLFRDTTGTYDNFYRFQAGLQFFAGALFFGVFFLDRSRIGTWTLKTSQTGTNKENNCTQSRIKYLK